MRTPPGRSAFEGSSREAELCEDAPWCAGIFRVRFGSETGNPQRSASSQRKLSTASSPSSFKTWVADEEEEDEELDPFGYVLAGSPVVPERGIIFKMRTC